jgi:hypothetical protein
VERFPLEFATAFKVKDEDAVILKKRRKRGKRRGRGEEEEKGRRGEGEKEMGCYMGELLEERITQLGCTIGHEGGEICCYMCELERKNTYQYLPRRSPRRPRSL